MTIPDYRSSIGLHFTDALGRRRTSFQLLNRDGKAEAIADFVGIKLVRFLTTERARIAAEAWRDGLIEAPLSEMLGGKI